MASVDYKISNFDGLCFKSGLYVGTDTNYTKIVNSAGVFIGAIAPTSIATTGTLSVTGVSTLSGQIRAGNGSVTVPSYSFSNAQTYGLYWTGSVLGIAANGKLAGSIGSSVQWVIGSRTDSSAAHQLNIFDTGNSLNAHLILSAGAASSTNFVIVKDRVDGKMTLSGSTTGANGARLELNGQSSGNANATVFYQGNTLLGGSIDANTKWIFGDTTSTQTHQMYGALNPTLGIIGVTTNSNAAAGTVGEYVESFVSSFTNYPGATTVWGNLTSVSLSAGDWTVTGILETTANGATVSAGGSAIAISVNSGTTTTDHVVGSNQISTQTPSAGTDRGSVLSSYRLSLAGTTTVYFKLKASYSVATPQYQCRLSARRTR